MEPQRGSAEARDGAGSESGQHHQQQQQQHQWRHGEWDPVGRDTGVSATLLGPFGTMAEPLNGGTAGADAGVRDVLAKPPAAAATAEWPAATAPAANAAPAAAAAAAAAAPAAGYMEMGAMNDFEILAHEKGDESDFSPMGVQPELEIPKDWMRDFVAKKEAFYKDASSAVPSGRGERFPTAGLSEVDLSRPAGSPRSDEDEPQIESCDSSPADDIVTEFPAPSALLAEGAVASLGGRGGPDAAGSPSGGPSDDKPPKKATSPDKPMEKLIFLAEEKYLETSAPQKRESSSPGDVETLTKHPRKEERVEARALHAGEKPSVVYHPGYSEAETISISQESSPLEEISPIADEFTDKLIAAGDEAQKKRQTSAEIEYSISLSQESSPGEDSSPVMGGMGRTFPKANVTATMQQQQRQQLSGADLSEEKQVPLAKKDNSLTSSYISSSTEESSSPGEEKSSAVDGGGTKVGGKEYFVEEVPWQAREVPGAKSGGGDEDKSPRVIATSTAAPREAGQTDPALAIESLGPSRGSMTNWYTEPPASLGDVSWRPAHGATAVGKSPEVAPTRGTGGGGGGWHAEEAPRETSLDTDDAAAACRPAGTLAACRAAPAPLVPTAAPAAPADAVARAHGGHAGNGNGDGLSRLVHGKRSPGEEFDQMHEESIVGRAPAAPIVTRKEEEEEEEHERMEAATKAAICAVQLAAREPGPGHAFKSAAGSVATEERNLTAGEAEDEEDEVAEEEGGVQLGTAAVGRDAASRAVEKSKHELSRALEKTKRDNRLAVEEVLQQDEASTGQADACQVGKPIRSEAAGRGAPPTAATATACPHAGPVPADGTGEGVPRPVAAQASHAGELPPPADAADGAASPESFAPGMAVEPLGGAPVTACVKTASGTRAESGSISFDTIGRASGEVKRQQQEEEQQPEEEEQPEEGEGEGEGEAAATVRDDPSNSLTEATVQNAENRARAAAAAAAAAAVAGDTHGNWDASPTAGDPVATETRLAVDERPSGGSAITPDRQRHAQRATPGGEMHGAGPAKAPALHDTPHAVKEVAPGNGATGDELGAAGPRAQHGQEHFHTDAAVTAGGGTASILADFGAGNAKQQPPQQPKQQPQQPPPPPQQQPRAVATAGVTAFGMPTPSGVRVIDSDDDEEEEDDEDDDEYEREFYPEATLTSPWVDKNPVALAGKEEETKAKPGGATAAPGPLGPATTAAPRAVEPLAPQAAAVQPRAPLASPAAAAGPPAPSGVVAAATAAKEEEPKVFRPSQPPPSWSGFGPPTVIIEEAAEEGAAEREAPAPEARPRRVGAPADARQERGQQGKDEEKKEEKEEEGKKEEKKLPAKLEEGTPRLSLLDKVHMPAVSRLVYWREPRRSGAVLAALLLLLLSIAHLSVFTIVGYLGLLVLACTITWRVGRGVLCAVQKREDGHPFRAYLAEDVSVTRERMSRQVEAARVWTTSAATELRRLLLVQDLVDSLKFAGVLWLMTYVGSVFNGISLLILGVVLLFSVPIAYEKKKTEIDHYLALVQAKVDDATARVKNVIPAALRPNEPSSVAK